MTMEDNDLPPEPVSYQPPRQRPSWSKSVGALVVSVSTAVAVLLGLSAVGVYFLQDKTASAPSPQTVTVTTSPKATTPADGADGRFLAALATYGISDNGTEAVRQRFMEFGHHTCFSLLPPKPQPLDSTVANIVTAENQDNDAGDPWAPTFTRDDARNLTQAAIDAYCPNVAK
ncbi:MAG: DUF732 domain-containing protein [Mycobacterium sp.]|nr:DUF732 domain-containing protein [Mycobacterium sp.]